MIPDERKLHLTARAAVGISLNLCECFPHAGRFASRRLLPLGDQATRVPRNHCLLIGFHYTHGDSASRARDRCRVFPITRWVELDAQELQSAAYSSAYVG